jgi:hypothetical protein
MFNINKINVRDKALKEYFRVHSRGLGVSIGIFKKQNKRFDALDSNKMTPYGIRRNKSNIVSKATNYSVALKNIKGYTGKNYSVPARNFFEKASKKEYWRKQNFKFLMDYYKAIPETSETTRRLGNLGKTILKRAINDSNEQPNAESTIEQKGFNSPLRDSGQLQDAINFRAYEPFGSV